MMIPIVKAHIVVALVAFLTTSLSMGDVKQEGVGRHRLDKELLKTNSITGHLRSSPDMTGEHVNNLRERRLTGNIEGVVTKAEGLMEKFRETQKRLWWRWTGTPDTMFTSLKLEVNVDMFSNPDFLWWENVLKNKYGDNAYDEMFKTMLVKSNYRTVAKAVFAVNEETPMAIQKSLLRKLGDAFPFNDIVTTLAPGEDANAILEFPVLKVLASFTVLKYGWRAPKLGWSAHRLLDILKRKYKDDNDDNDINLIRALAKGHYEDESSEAGSLYKAQLLCWKWNIKNEKSEEFVFEQLGLKKADASLPSNLLVSTWLDYVYFRISEGGKPTESQKDEMVVMLKDSPVNELLGQANDGPLSKWKELLQDKFDEEAWKNKYRELIL